MNWTQRLCARFLGIDKTTWVAWEHGRSGPSAKNAKAVRAMLALTETEQGRKELEAWARDVDARRDARRAGRSADPQ